MSTSYPSGLDSYTTKVDGVDDVMASHINNPQDAIVAIETNLGADADATDGYEAWTPTITQGVAVSVTIDVSKVKRIGNTCHLTMKLTCTSAGTAGQPVIIGGIPTPAETVAGYYMGLGTYDPAAGADQFFAVYAVTATSWRFRNLATGANFGLADTLANGDQLGFDLTYYVS
jgi:hypothetical protein